MILAILQARMSSSRLPGKVLKEIMGKPMLELQIERILRSKQIDKLVVATSDCKEDDAIESLCKKLLLDCYRGSLNNVLDRFYNAALQYIPNHIVRLTGDCPLTDPEVIDDLIRFYLDGDYDYANNCSNPMLPDGLDAEIFSFAALKKAWEVPTNSLQQEHVTLYFEDNPQIFQTAVLTYHYDHSHLRWTVDEPQDFEFVQLVYQKLYPKNTEFSFKDVLKLIEDQPELTLINAEIARNEGMIQK